ncbi:MAG: hypothetical protein EOP70_19015 [Variovorax sp.]|nr:MAG: hypothetical protein EOP70_19015 [Variovorax sp.]
MAPPEPDSVRAPMSTFFRDTFTSDGLEVIRGSLPPLGFVPQGGNRAYEGSTNINPMRRSPEGARTLSGSGGAMRIVYGLDVSDIGGSPGNGDGWVPGSADGWTAEWDWHLDYYSATDGSSQNHGEIQLGNARTKNILVEFLQIGGGRIDLRLGHGATGYGGSPGQVRMQCPDINAVGKYHCRLEYSPRKIYLYCGGAQLALDHDFDEYAGGFNSLVIQLQPTLQLANLEIATGVVTPPKDPVTFWTGYVDAIET